MSAVTSLTRFKDFSITFRGNDYYVSSILLRILSEKIRLLIKDKIFKIDLPDIDGQIDDLISYLNGNKVDLNKENIIFLNISSSVLGLSKLKQETLDYVMKLNDKTLLLELAFLLYKHNLENKLVNIIASRIDDFFCVPLLKELTPEFISTVFVSDSLNCYDTISLLNILLDYYPSSPEIMKKALKSFLKKDLSIISISLLERNMYINLNDFKEEMKQLVFQDSKSISIDDEFNSSTFIPLYYSINNNFHGVFHYLNLYCFDKNTRITSSHPYGDAFQASELLNDNPKTYFSSKAGPYAYVQIELIKYSLIPTHYSLTSCPAASSGICPLSWTLEGSNDGKNWKILDKKINFRDLCYNSKQVSYRIEQNHAKYTFFKISQFESCGNVNNRFVLSGIELYGGLFQNK